MNTPTAPKPLTDEELAGQQLDWLDGAADKWAADVNITDIVRNATSPVYLTRGAPDDVREEFASRMRTQVDALIRQAFVEGAMYGLDLRNDLLKQAHAENAALREDAVQCGESPLGNWVWRCKFCESEYSAHRSEPRPLPQHEPSCPLHSPTAAGKALLDELTELRTFKERMRGIQFSPTGDNHHNALLCPHCNPEQIDPVKLKAEVARLRGNQRTPGTVEVCPDYLGLGCRWFMHDNGAEAHQCRAQGCPIRASQKQESATSTAP